MYSGKTRKKSRGSGGGKTAVAELLVFGYACKLFRDDEKAVFHEQGRQLIPWMGEPQIMIDRYDGRGHLHDLSEYDAEHNSWNRNYNLSEEEARIEALCDEERYLALHTDLLEEEARQDEEYKRLSEALAEDGTYNATGYHYKSDYYDPSQPTEEEETQKDKDDRESSDQEDNEEPFIAPDGLNVPSDVELPPTAKMHAIIERTANFVCKQGAQFEIMLKAKQARNSQFDFLRFDHYLNPYYKHILKAMKEGRYTSQSVKENEAKKNSANVSTDEDDDDEDGSDYLHPSLFASKRCSRLEELTKPLKVIDPDHPLAALVRKAQTERLASQMAANNVPPQAAETESPAESTVTSTFYNYYMLPDGTYCLAPPTPGMEVNNSYNASSAAEAAQAAVCASVTAPHSSTSPPPSLINSDSRKMAQATSSISTLTPVVAIIPPPPDIQPVIDKLAQYVARNGIKFETSVQAKNDSRFDFLQSWHQYNPYYEFKKQFFMQKEGTLNVQPVSILDGSSTSADLSTNLHSDFTPQDQFDGGTTSDANSSKAHNDGKMKASFAPISFAIKVKETDLLPLEKNRVKLDDDSEEEVDGEGNNGQQNKSKSNSTSSQSANTAAPTVEERKPQLTPEELEAKQAKQKLEDRLAAAAREKLAQASKESKEKQLQAERKRKAALFLQTLRNPMESELGRTEETACSPERLQRQGRKDIYIHTGRKKKRQRQTQQEKVAGGAGCDDLLEDVIVPTTEYPVYERSPCRVSSHQEKERKKKKRKKRSRSRSRSPAKDHYDSKSKSRSHAKTKHALPTAYRTVRRSRSRSPKKQSQSSDRRREEERGYSSGYHFGHNPGNSRKRSRSRSPQECKKKRHSRSQAKSKQKSYSGSTYKQEGSNSPVHSTSISPVESRGSSQERYRGVTQDKDCHIASEIVSSVQTKITQDLMSKVRAMLAASKSMRNSAS